MLNASGAPQVGCVLVNWNNAPDTLACLDSLARQDYPNLRVVVVDNASTDGSASLLRNRFPHLALLESDRNAGFPVACNLGARHLLAEGAELIWLLNNDTMVPPETCSRLVAAAAANPAAGVIGSVLYYMHAPDRVQAWGGGNISRLTGYNRHRTRPFPLGRSAYLTFASVVIPRAVFERLGGLYEGAFMYYEDSDFCMRAQSAGYTLAVAADTAILHREGGSHAEKNPELDRIVTDAGLHFLSRHAPLPFLSRAAYVGSRLVRRLARLDLRAMQAVLAGVRDWRSSRRAATR